MLIVPGLQRIQYMQLISHCFHLGVSVSDFGSVVSNSSVVILFLPTLDTCRASELSP